MVLGQLGSRLATAIKDFSNASVADEKAVTTCINEITHALLQADVQFKLVQNLAMNVRKSVQNLPPGHSKRHIIYKAVLNELASILEPGTASFVPTKGRSNVVMFVGLQGSGKTTTCSKYAFHFKKKGFRPALVCADTFRAGAFDQLKQNASKADVPFYGSYTQTDPVVIAQEGVQTFKAAKRDLIIIDTSGRHKQESALFEEMRHLASATKPDLIVLVMDGTIGQAAVDHANAFKESTTVGVIVITKLDGHAKGGGALSAVAATKSPIIFLGTGEKLNDLQMFEAESFAKKLLGMGDLKGLMDKIKDNTTADDEAEMVERLTKGNVTFEFVCDQMENISSMGSLSEVVNMFPGLDMQNIKLDQSMPTKKYRTILNSMTNKERQSTSLSESQISRISRGSGTSIVEIRQMVDQAKLFSDQAKLLSKKLKSKSLKTSNSNSMLKQLGGLVKQLPR